MGKLRKRMSFSRIDEVLEMPDLIEVQKNSYQRFLDTDLREVLNDATAEDAAYVGLDRIAQVIPNGNTVSGTVYNMLSEEARTVLDTADVILAKGQGNFETLNGQGRHIFYAFLCKCDMFTDRFEVPRLTGILVEETAQGLLSGDIQRNCRKGDLYKARIPLA